MKKALTYILAAVLLLASLTACGKQADDSASTDTPVTQNQTSSSQAEQSAPAKSEQTGPESIPEPLSHSELLDFFEITYQTVATDSEDSLDQELYSLMMSLNINGKPYPSDYAEQYKKWRPQEEAVTENQTEESEDELFKSVNETVYATEKVNIRESYSAASTKLGQLTRGQSVTRIGVGQGEASDWSQVRLSDGRTAYINSKYLSTTKPTTQPSNSKPANNTGSSGGNSGGSSNSGSSGNSNNSSGGSQQGPYIPPDLSAGVTGGGENGDAGSGGAHYTGPDVIG